MSKVRWSDPKVVDALNSARNGQLSLSALQKQIKFLTGIDVAKTTLSYRARGMTTRKSQRGKDIEKRKLEREGFVFVLFCIGGVRPCT